MRYNVVPPHLILALSAVLAAPSIGFAQEYAAGYEILRITDQSRTRPIHLDIWYPSVDGKEQPHDYGFSVGRIAPQAGAAGDGAPVVLLSHGAMGAATNYSWIAEHLARRGFVVLGVSHFAESPVFGPESVRPEAASRFGDRIRDLDVALKFLLEHPRYAGRVDTARLGAIGHSSGGSSVLMLAGADFEPARLAAHCASDASAGDKGCAYAEGASNDAAAQAPMAVERELRALVMMDPAVGPGFAEPALRSLSIPTLVVASVDNDFLPYASHAGHIVQSISTAELVRLDAGEGHFVFLDVCTSPVAVFGIPLCFDRRGVDREAVHESLASTIAQFLALHLNVREAEAGEAPL